MKICHKEKLEASTSVELKPITWRRDKDTVPYTATGDYILCGNTLGTLVLYGGSTIA